MAPCGTLAVTTGIALLPEALAVERSAGPVSRARSDGLIGLASTRTTTSSAAGSGVGISTSEISSSPLVLINERSCSPVAPSKAILNPPLPVVWSLSIRFLDDHGQGRALIKAKSGRVVRDRFARMALRFARSGERLQRRLARICRLLAELLLDAQQLVVFRGAVGARERSGLDLPAIGGDREIGDGGVFRLAGAMRHHGSVAGLVGHLDGRERLGQRADLVDLDEDGIGAAVSDAVGETRDVGDEEVVADQLALGPDQVGQLLPALHVVLGHAVLDRDDRIAGHQIGEILRLLGPRAGLVLAAIDVVAVLEELGRGAIQRQHDVAAEI